MILRRAVESAEKWALRDFLRDDETFGLNFILSQFLPSAIGASGARDKKT